MGEKGQGFIADVFYYNCTFIIVSQIIVCLCARDHIIFLSGHMGNLFNYMEKWKKKGIIWTLKCIGL